MSRDTMGPQWSAADDVIAGRISDAVAAATRPLIGTAAVVRAARLPHRAGKLTASVRLAQRVMPRATELHPRRHPGLALVYLPRLRAYVSTADPDLIIEGIIEARLKKAVTVLVRAAAEAEGLDPSSLLGGTVRSHIGASLLALTSPVWDAVIADMRSKH